VTAGSGEQQLNDLFADRDGDDLEFDPSDLRGFMAMPFLNISLTCSIKAVPSSSRSGTLESIIAWISRIK